MFKYPFFSFLCLMCTSFYCFADFYVPSNVLPQEGSGDLPNASFYQLSSDGVIKNQVELSNAAIVTSGIKYKNTLYFAGGGVPDDLEKPRPTLWIYDLGLGAVQEKIIVSEGSLTALIENEGKLFLVGLNNEVKSTLWICDLQGNLIQSVLLDQAGGANQSGALKIIKAKGKIYITGYVNDEIGSSNPILWILDKNGALISSKTLQTPLLNQKAGPIVCISNNLYILASGTLVLLDTGDPFIWVTDLEGNLITSRQFDDENQSDTFSLLRRGNQLLVLGAKGDNLESKKPTIWVLDRDLNVVSTTSFDQASSFLLAGTLIGSSLYTVGVKALEEQQTNVFWKVLPNGSVELTSFFGDGVPFDIIPSSSFEESLLRANQLFSPIRTQPGVN